MSNKIQLDDVIKYLEKAHAYERAREAKTASQYIAFLVERLQLQAKEIHELKRKTSLGEINELHAKALEESKGEISGLKAKINKLEQKLESKG